MEYPIDEQKQYPLIKQCVEKLFASRVKNPTEKIVNIWISEIMTHNFTESALKKATRKFVEDDSYSLSLPVYLDLVRDNTTYKNSLSKDCPYCQGTGTVGNTIAFDLNGNLIDCVPYMLNCYCNNNKQLLQMAYNESNHNKTYANGFYLRVFTSLDKQDLYLKKVHKNGGKDILRWTTGKSIINRIKRKSMRKKRNGMSCTKKG